MFRIGILFRGDDNNDQLFKIAEIMGTADINKYVQKFKLNPDPKRKEFLESRSLPKHKWEELVAEENRSLANEEALDLLKRMLVIDHVKISAIVDRKDHCFGGTQPSLLQMPQKIMISILFQKLIFIIIFNSLNNK